MLETGSPCRVGASTSREEVRQRQTDGRRSNRERCHGSGTPNPCLSAPSGWHGSRRTETRGTFVESKAVRATCCRVGEAIAVPTLDARGIAVATNCRFGSSEEIKVTTSADERPCVAQEAGERACVVNRTPGWASLPDPERARPHNSLVVPRWRELSDLLGLDQAGGLKCGSCGCSISRAIELLPPCSGVGGSPGTSELALF